MKKLLFDAHQVLDWRKKTKKKQKKKFRSKILETLLKLCKSVQVNQSSRNHPITAKQCSQLYSNKTLFVHFSLSQQLSTNFKNTATQHQVVSFLTWELLRFAKIKFTEDVQRNHGTPFYKKKTSL